MKLSKEKIVKGVKNSRKIWLYFSKKIQVLLVDISFYINHLKEKKNIIFEITSPGEFWFVEPIWHKLNKSKSLDIYFSVRINNDVSGLQWSDFSSLLVQYGISKSKIITPDIIRHTRFLDLFLSPTAWIDNIPQNVPKVQIFHTIGSKSMLSIDNLLKFTVLFLTGPNQKEEFQQKFIKKYPEVKHIKTFDIGYPKSDPLIKREYNREKIIKKLSIDPKKPTIIYAPNWEQSASLFQMGHEIIQILATMNINLLIKLHHMSLRGPKDYNATGGIDWRGELIKYQQKYSNVKPIFDLNSNEYLYVSDVMVTDAGGVGLEYLLLDKPIVFVDVPEYFERCGRDGIDYWVRNNGILVKKPKDIPGAIQTSLDNPMELSALRKDLIGKMIYNPGNSSDKAAEIILELLHDQDYEFNNGII